MAEFVREKDEAEFISWMLKQGTSKGTISLRRSGLHHFARWYHLSRGRVLTPADMTDDDFDAYEQHLWGSRKPVRERNLLAGGTINTYLSAAKAFLKWVNEATPERS
jgi:site-specific recombinase XerD